MDSSVCDEEGYTISLHGGGGGKQDIFSLSSQPILSNAQ